MRKSVVIAAMVALSAGPATAAFAGAGPSGSEYQGDFWADYAVACASGERVAGPADVTVVVYDGPNGREVCVEQRDAEGYPTGPVSGRAWLTADGVLHVDAPTAAARDYLAGLVGDRTEVEVDDERVRINGYSNDYGYTTEQRDTYAPLEGTIHRESQTTGDYGGGSSQSDTRVGPDGYSSTSASDYSEGYYGSYDRGSSETSIGADGYRSQSTSEDGSYYSGQYSSSSDRSIGPDGVHVHDESSYYDSSYYYEESSRDADVDADGAVVKTSSVSGNDFGYTLVSLTPSAGLAILLYESGHDECYQYGSSTRGVRWDPLNDLGSLPELINNNDRPPCDY